ncbi:hypothetical protein [Bacillus sp. FSL K6-3431]|uniref:hypothetical protein n=1 Tax=Bacillus sp. FSL K6-3431 TaxID=2921500 RepID=UPI0030FC4508
MLSYADLAEIIPKTSGIKNVSIHFHTITLNSSIPMAKGLFIYNNADPDLLEAIGNGAIAAIWPHDVKLPHYTPNHFPIFYVNKPVDSLIVIVKKHINKIILNNSGDMTNMILKSTELPTEDTNIREVISLLSKKNDDNQNGREHI